MKLNPPRLSGENSLYEMIEKTTGVITRDNLPNPMYIIRVFNRDFSFDKYTDDIYMRRSDVLPDTMSFAIPESEVDPKTVSFEVRCWNVDEAIEAWYYIRDRFIGHTYCMKAVLGVYEDLIIGGILDLDDIDAIESQLALYPYADEKYTGIEMLRQQNGFYDN